MEAETTNETGNESPPMESGHAAPSAAGNACGGGKAKHGLTAGSLPAGASWIGKLTHQFKRALETAVAAEKGAVSIVDACAINTATRAERLALLANRWLRIEAGNMLPAERLAFAREVLKASEARDRAVRSLGLGKPQQSELDAYYSGHGWPAGGLSEAGSAPQSDSAPDASTGHPDALAGMPQTEQITPVPQ